MFALALAAVPGIGAGPPGAEAIENRERSDSDANPPARLTEDSPEVRAELIAEGFDAPLLLTEPDDGSDRLFVVDQVGSIWIVEDGEKLDQPFLDIGDELIELEPSYDERGLLGLAFHPDYAENGRFFVYYSAPARDQAPEEWDHTSVLAEYTVSDDDPDRADPESARVVMEIDQPFENHNAGQILFGDDGLLYVPLGDGGNGGDADPEDDQRGRPPNGNAQTVTNLLGSVLRIDVDSEQPYAVPDDNVFVEGPGRDEIFAYGLRNPYGFSRDLETGDLYAFEAGQALFEEVNLIEPGGNYGWNIREGLSCFDPDDHLDPPAHCRETGYLGEELIDPVLVYQRSPQVGSVVVPGVMYRGESMPEYEGRLIFGDYSRIRFIPEGLLYLGEPQDGGPGKLEQMRVVNPIDRRADGSLNRFLLGVSQDLDGEAYAMTTSEGGPTGGTGQVFQLTSAEEDGPGRDWWSWVLVGAAIVILATISLVVWRRRSRTESGRDP